MRFILDEQKLGGYDYGVKTSYSEYHLGKDWKANFVPLHAPEDGLIVKVMTGLQGGKTIWFKPTGKTIILRWLHLSEFKVKQGDYVKEGAIIAITGNTGQSTGPHCHEDHWPKGDVTLNFADTQNPLIYYTTMQTTFMKVTLVANKITWDYKAQLAKVSEWFKTYSGGKLEVVFDSKDVNFDNVPLMPFQGHQAVEINWYRTNITPLATGQETVLLLNPNQYQQPGIWGFMTYGDTGKPVRMEVSCGNEISDINFPEAHLVVHRIFHEICHSLYFLTGQPDVSHTDPTQPRVHELLFVPEAQLPASRAILLNEIDYTKLQAKLITIKPVEKIRVRKVGWNAPDAEKGVYVPFDTLEHQSLVLAKINEVLPSYELDTTKEYNLGKRPF